LPRAWTLREAGNGPVVTRSSSTLGTNFAAASGAESGIVDLRCTGCTKTRVFREEEVGFCRGVPVPTPARPGSGSKGCRAPLIVGRRRLSPLPGHPLDATIIRRLSPCRQDRHRRSGSRGGGAASRFPLPSGEECIDAQLYHKNISYISYLSESWDTAETLWQGYFDDFMMPKSLKNRLTGQASKYGISGTEIWRSHTTPWRAGQTGPVGWRLPRHDAEDTPRSCHQGGDAEGGALHLQGAGVS
jgi:hypothetical protein